MCEVTETTLGSLNIFFSASLILLPWVHEWSKTTSVSVELSVIHSFNKLLLCYRGWSLHSCSTGRFKCPLLSHSCLLAPSRVQQKVKEFQYLAQGHFSMANAKEHTQTHTHEHTHTHTHTQPLKPGFINRNLPSHTFLCNLADISKMTNLQMLADEENHYSWDAHLLVSSAKCPKMYHSRAHIWQIHGENNSAACLL